MGSWRLPAMDVYREPWKSKVCWQYTNYRWWFIFINSRTYRFCFSDLWPSWQRSYQGTLWLYTASFCKVTTHCQPMLGMFCYIYNVAVAKGFLQVWFINWQLSLSIVCWLTAVNKHCLLIVSCQQALSIHWQLSTSTVYSLTDVNKYCLLTGSCQFVLSIGWQLSTSTACRCWLTDANKYCLLTESCQ